MPKPSEQPADQAEPPAPVDHNLVFAKARELVEIKVEADSLNDRLNDLKIRKKRVADFLLDAFANEPDLGQLRVGGYTIYPRKQGWASAADKVAAYEALVAAGLDDFALKTFNVQSVSGLYREWERNGEKPPAELEGIIEFKDTYEVGMTKAGS